MKKFNLLVGAAAASMMVAACSNAAETPAEGDTVMTEETAPADEGVPVAANPMVGGAEMMPTMNIVENASKSPIHTTLVAAVKQAGLVETLSGAGPFTVFAPTNDAFAKVPKATVDGLMAPEGKDSLTKVLTYHVIPGKISAADLVAKINEGNGTAKMKTVAGEELTFTLVGESVKVAGMGGSLATVTQADVNQSNGVIHVIDGVLTPSM